MALSETDKYACRLLEVLEKFETAVYNEVLFEFEDLIEGMVVVRVDNYEKPKLISKKEREKRIQARSIYKNNLNLGGLKLHENVEFWEVYIVKNGYNDALTKRVNVLFPYDLITNSFDEARSGKILKTTVSEFVPLDIKLINEIDPEKLYVAFRPYFGLVKAIRRANGFKAYYGLSVATFGRSFYGKTSENIQILDEGDLLIELRSQQEINQILNKNH